jgi:hypothetical protein
VATDVAAGDEEGAGQHGRAEEGDDEEELHQVFQERHGTEF